MDALAQIELQTVLTYAAAAAVAALAVVIALGVSLHADLTLRGLFVPVATAMVIVVPAIGMYLSGRDITAVDFAAFMDLPAAMIWFLRLVSLALLGLCAVRIGSQLLGRSPSHRAPVALLVALLAYYAGNYVLNGLFGSNQGLPLQQSMYSVLLLVAVFLSAGQIRLPAVLSVVKGSLLVVMGASLALLAIEPSLVRQVEMAEIRLPFVDYRFFGLGANPNSIASLAMVSLLLSIYQRFSWRSLEVANVLVSLAVLLLAQSQTAWLATLLTVPVLLLGRAEVRILDQRTLFTLGGLASAAALAALGALTFSTHGVALTDFATGERYRELTTLTGRSAIWDVALAEWRENPLFGYGPSMWDTVHRGRLGMPFAFNAHNQLMQSLSVAGAVGMATLLPYLLLLGLLSFTAPRPARGLALALYLMILIRSITEVPLDLGTPFANDFLPHYLLFVILATSHRARGAEALAGTATVDAEPTAPASRRSHEPPRSRDPREPNETAHV
jgi:O-antigen ligase